MRTVLLSDGNEVRMKGLAAPDECWADAATTFAKTMLLDKPVKPTQEGDELVSLRLADGTEYAVLAVELGMVRNEAAEDPAMREAEASASLKRLGLWGPPCDKSGSPPNPATSAPTPKPTTGCSIAYRITHKWQGGFRTDVTIGNTGTAEINGWTLQWTFADGQKVSEMWNATPEQSGGELSATAVSYNKLIPPGGSLLMGFTGTSGTANADPRTFSLNGHACAIV